MKKVILVASTLLVVSASFAQQHIQPTQVRPPIASDSSVSVSEKEIQLALDEVKSLQSQLRMAKIRRNTAIVVGATTGVSGLLASAIARQTYKSMATIIPDHGDIIPGKMEAPWIIRITVKAADKTAKVLQKAVPLLIAVPTVAATGGAVVFTVYEMVNISNLEKALATAAADYDLALAALK